MEIKTRTLRQDVFSGTQQWDLGYLDAAEKEARDLLTSDQYAHAIDLFDCLSFESDPGNSETQNVRKLYEFYELRDKGGILRNINLRVYFAIIPEKRLILVLSVYKKEDEDQVPPHMVARVRNRLRAAKEKMGMDKCKG